MENGDEVNAVKATRPRQTNVQKREFINSLLDGLQTTGWTGIVKIHINQGGFSRTTKEEEIHQTLLAPVSVLEVYPREDDDIADVA